MASITATSIKDKVALVTGGTGSIGGEICKSLAAQGVQIIIVDLNESKCEEFAATLPSKCVGIAINVADDEAVNVGVDIGLEKLGAKGVDILVNVAGILSNNKLIETTTSEWKKVHAVNYDSCFYLSKKCVPYMLEQKFGRIVNMSSWAWKSGGLTAGTAYSASKAAMVGLTFSLARQYAGDGITVNAIAPCYVFSPMISEKLTQEQRDELLQKIPVKRFCGPDEVAHAVSFFVSPLSGFITGEVLDMNGGFQMD